MLFKYFWANTAQVKNEGFLKVIFSAVKSGDSVNSAEEADRLATSTPGGSIMLCLGILAPDLCLNQNEKFFIFPCNCRHLQVSIGRNKYVNEATEC